mgnify:CR=1 FL=1
MRRPPSWFRALLSLLPERFRREHGEEICELASRYAEGRSAPGRALVWARAGLDLLVVAARGRTGLFDGLVRDVRYGVRSLRRDLGFALFAVAIVGLGIGASVTVFSVARALLLRPLPFDDPDRLVFVSNGDFGRGQALSAISVQSGHVESLRASATQFVDVGGYHLFDREGDHTLHLAGGPVRATRLRVTDNFFDVLGVEPIVGRLFAPDEVLDESPPVILLTWPSWQRHFQGDPGVIGSSVRLDATSATVIGVLPASFDYTQIFAPGSRVDYVAPFPWSERSHRTGNTLAVIGRLAPGATLASAQAEAEAAVLPPGERINDFEPVVTPLREHLSGGYRPTVLLLSASVVLVMLMVCANLSNLLLARGAARERELSIRAAIGAERRRLVQQLLTESLMLAGAGTLLGVLLAVNGTRLLATLDLRIPMLGQTRVDATALVLAVGAAAAVALLFGVAPALRGTDVDPGESLQDGARGSSHGRGHSALRRMLVVSQVAMACLLLVASTLTARSLVHLTRTDLGYEPGGTIAMRIDPSQRFDDDEVRVRYLSDVLDAVRAAPGVRAAGLADMLPMAFNRRWDARAIDRSDERVFPYMRLVSEGYVEAMGLEVVEGRSLTADDGPDAPSVGLINEVLARALWGDDSPVGSRVRTSGREFEVVGVVRSTRQLSVDQEPGPEMFLHIRQLADHNAIHLIVRADRPTEDMVALTRAAVRGVDGRVPLDQVVALGAVVDSSLAPRRFLAWLLGSFAAFALALAALGIYAVVSYSVAQRRREIGIRIALGATSTLVVRHLVRDTLTMTALGLTAGLGLALAASGLIRGLLYGVAADDPLTLGAVALVLLSVAVAASWLPARRALAVSPVEAVSGEIGGRG